MKVSELTGDNLDYWVAKAQPNSGIYIASNGKPYISYDSCEADYYHPSTNWQQCGELITDFGIEVKPLQNRMDGSWYAICKYYSCYRNNGSVGLSAQEAICRAVCASVYGEEVSDE